MPTSAMTFGTYDFTAYCQDWNESFPQTIERVTVPRRDGVLASDGRPGEKRVTVRGILHAATAAALRTLEDAMLSAFRNTAAQTPWAKLRVWDDRYILAQLDGWQADWMRSAVPYTAKRWQATFAAQTPYWIGDAANSETQTPTGATDTFSLTGGGTAAAYPVLTLTATGPIAAGLTLVNETANQYLSYGEALSASDVLVLDHDALTATLNGANVLADLSGDFWPILPGANTIRYQADVDDATLTIAWRDRWH